MLWIETINSGGTKRSSLLSNDLLTSTEISSTDGYLGQISNSFLIQKRLKKLKAKQSLSSNTEQSKVLYDKEKKRKRRKTNMKRVLHKAVIGGYLSERVTKNAHNHVKCIIWNSVFVFLRIAFVSFILTGRLGHNGRDANHPFCWNHVDLRKCSFEGTNQCKIVCSFGTSADTRKIFIPFLRL